MILKIKRSQNVIEYYLSLDIGDQITNEIALFYLSENFLHFCKVRIPVVEDNEAVA